VEVNSSFKELIENNPNLEMYPSPTDEIKNLNDEINESIRNKKSLELEFLQDKVDLEIKKFGHSVEVQQETLRSALTNNNPSSENSTKYSELVRAIANGKDVVVYSQDENGGIFKEWSSTTSSSKGD
jgi:hypothetical protein